MNDITEFVQKQLTIFSFKRIFDTKEKTCPLPEMLLVWTIMAILDGIGGFQLLDLIISEFKSYMTC